MRYNEYIQFEGVERTMAKYDRRILVPYLTDVYSMELLCNEAQRYLQELRSDIRLYHSKLAREVPPEEPQSMPLRWALAFLAGALASTIVTIFLFTNDDSFFRILLGFFGIWLSFFLWGGTFDTLKIRMDCKNAYDVYLEDLERYASRGPIRIQYEQELYRLENEETSFEEKMEKIFRLRDNVYGVNIIPSNYRNLYAAHYLYQYFSSSDADDIDMILQTFVLEEIKDRLDDILERQTEMILNQRAMIANQEAANAAMAKRHEQQMKQIASLNENAKNQTKYLSMINANLAVSNYFAYKEYINT